MKRFHGFQEIHETKTGQKNIKTAKQSIATTMPRFFKFLVDFLINFRAMLGHFGDHVGMKFFVIFITVFYHAFYEKKETKTLNLT